jgi:excisionase family DNA binding protein
MRTSTAGPAGVRPGGALLDIAGVAERLAVTERFVRRLVFERRIPFLKIGHFVRFDPVEVERWIAQARVPEDSRR